MPEILASNLKEYVETSNHCVFSNGCVIDKVGRASFNFENSGVVKIYFRRVSGNGKVIVNDKEFVVSSKISQEFSIEFLDKLEISRPKESIGDIEIFGIELLEGTLNWKDLVRKCGKYRNLRLIGGKLFVSEGGYLDREDIITVIETSPPNMWERKDGKVKFLGACEIVNMEVSTEVSIPKPKPNPPFVHREAPTFIPPIIQKQSGSNVFYDSGISNTFANYKGNKKSVRYIRSVGIDYLLLRKDGAFSIPMSSLQADTEYSVIVTMKRMNGNGGVRIGFSGGSSQDVVSDSRFSDKVILLRTGNTGNGHELMISKPDGVIGEVLIQRIAVADKNTVSITNVPYQTQNTLSNNVYSYKKFVIVIPSYKNIKWCEKNITSALSQNYKNYRVIFTDDCSPDGTFDAVKEIVDAHPNKDKVTLIHNKERIGALENLYNMIHSCDDDEIILTLDGDDWFPDANVLNRLNRVYSSGNVWLTYGQYQNYPGPGLGIARQITDAVIRDNSFRSHAWCASHLRTFYTWLFKKIKLEDFKYEGQFMSMAWDMTIMFPMLEMAGVHSKFIPDVMYVYNLENPINDHKVNVELQRKLDKYVRGMPRYSVVQQPKKSIGLMLIATGKYDRFIPGLISSADNYFLKDNDCKVTYYVFTDSDNNIVSNRNVVKIPIEHRPFPFASMDRFAHFTKHADKLSNEEYLFYIDVDSSFVDHVSKDILGSLVGVRHCGWTHTLGPVEKNVNSVFYTNPSRYKNYFGGGFSGGKANNYLDLAKWCYEMIEKDAANGIIPIWHDETAINRYFVEHEPDVILTPSYHYPQGEINRYKKMWAPNNYAPKILLLDKKHSEVRGE